MCSFSLNTNNSQGLECVVEGWKTQKGEDLGDRKALKPVAGENTGKKWHFLAPRWRSKVTKREIGGRRSCRWCVVVGIGSTHPHALLRGRCCRREMTCVAVRH